MGCESLVWVMEGTPSWTSGGEGGACVWAWSRSRGAGSSLGSGARVVGVAMSLQLSRTAWVQQWHRDKPDGSGWWGLGQTDLTVVTRLMSWDRVAALEFPEDILGEEPQENGLPQIYSMRKGENKSHVH